jgi:MraZ protein
VFIGEYHHNIDEKGRVQVPAKWRSRLAEGAVVTKGFDGSLNLYPLSVWSEIAEKLAALPQSQPSVRAYVRQTLAGAVDVEVDKLGRIVVPPLLKGYANLKKGLVLAGLHDHIELWDASTWETYVQSIDGNSPELAATLQGLGL